MQKLSPKICILVDSLSKGGAEKAAAELSNLLFKNGNSNVFIISLKDDITYSYSGQLINLGLGESKIKIVKQIRKTLSLRKALREINPSCVLDFRMRCRVVMEYVLHRLVFDREKMVYVIQNYNIDWHIPKGNFFFKRYTKGQIVAVSKGIKLKLESDYSFKNVTYIPNFIDFGLVNKMSTLYNVTEENYIVAIGRLTNHTKQHDKLIKAYSKSNLPAKNIKLLILGEGNDKDNLENLIEELSLKGMVIMKGYLENPFPYLKKAKFKVLSSKVEGLPLSIIEALAIGTPVVSFDCKTGPSEMINGKNGILVEDQNFEAFKNAMELLISDENKLLELKINAQKYITEYSSEVNLGLWKNLIVN